jgi:NADH-quinone oxidoreductase subunit L
MLELLWLIPALPLAGFCCLLMAGPRLPKQGVAIIGAGSVGVSAVLAVLVSISFIVSPPADHAFSQTLWTWMEVSDLKAGISFDMDPLSLTMILVITFVGFLIHLYSVEYMKEDEGYSRFFAYMNLFVGSMLTLVLADNLLLLYMGWEGVGLCSYLLIGFWYKDPENGRAGRKAFIVTRVGDVALAAGIFLLYTHFRTLQIQELMQQVSFQWKTGSVLATAAALLFLGGALGKSAQVPLQTWLPDAMAGPTPVSALIHAATMVTAGVYLIARMHLLFSLSPLAMSAVAVIGAVTLLLAGCSALVQRDIKRVLAYSTISQIGYMFLALGVGAWSAAIFHFMVHAFFKALLFLGAGVVIAGLGHERDIFRMGGLRRQLPFVFWTFFSGAASLSSIPLFTAGFYSKEFILSQVRTSPSGGTALLLTGLAGAFLTSLYTFRMVFLVFFGEEKAKVSENKSLSLKVPLVILSFFSIAGGLFETPQTLGGLSFFTDFMRTVLPALDQVKSVSSELPLQIAASLVSLAGVWSAYLLFLRRPSLAESAANSWAGSLLHRLWSAGWGFDWLYDIIIVRPFLWIARANKNDFIDLIYGGTAWYSEQAYRLLSFTQSGNLRWYAAVLAFGAVVFIALVVSV